MSNNYKITLGILFFLAAVVVAAWWIGHTPPGGALLKPESGQLQTQNQPDQRLQDQIQLDLARQIQAASQNINGVEDSTAVALDQDVFLALQVSGLDRLRLNKIRQTAHQKSTQIAPGYEVHVTTDKKIFFLLQQIELQLAQNQNISYQDLKNRLKKINKLMQG